MPNLVKNQKGAIPVGFAILFLVTTLIGIAAGYKAATTPTNTTSKAQGSLCTTIEKVETSKAHPNLGEDFFCKITISSSGSQFLNVCGIRKAGTNDWPADICYNEQVTDANWSGNTVSIRCNTTRNSTVTSYIGNGGNFELVAFRNDPSCNPGGSAVGMKTTPIQIGSVAAPSNTPVPGIPTATPGSNPPPEESCLSNLNIAPSTVAPNQNFSAYFSFRSDLQSSLNCGIQYGDREEFVSSTGCSFAQVIGSSMTFSCRAPSAAGNYKTVCYTWDTSKGCGDVRKNFTVGTVNATATPTSPAATSTPIPTTPPGVPTNTPVPTGTPTPTPPNNTANISGNLTITNPQNIKLKSVWVHLHEAGSNNKRAKWITSYDASGGNFIFTDLKVNQKYVIFAIISDYSNNSYINSKYDCGVWTGREGDCLVTASETQNLTVTIGEGASKEKADIRIYSSQKEGTYKEGKGITFAYTLLKGDSPTIGCSFIGNDSSLGVNCKNMEKAFYTYRIDAGSANTKNCSGQVSPEEFNKDVIEKTCDLKLTPVEEEVGGSKPVNPPQETDKNPVIQPIVDTVQKVTNRIGITKPLDTGSTVIKGKISINNSTVLDVSESYVVLYNKDRTYFRDIKLSENGVYSFDNLPAGSEYLIKSWVKTSDGGWYQNKSCTLGDAPYDCLVKTGEVKNLSVEIGLQGLRYTIDKIQQVTNRMLRSAESLPVIGPLINITVTSAL